MVFRKEFFLEQAEPNKSVLGIRLCGDNICVSMRRQKDDDGVPDIIEESYDLDEFGRFLSSVYSHVWRQKTLRKLEQDARKSPDYQPH